MNIPGLIKQWFTTASQKQKLTAALLAFSLLSTLILFALNGSSTTGSDPLNSTPFYFLGVFVKLIGVLLLIVASAVVFRRWFQPGFNGKATRQLHLVETVRLSPKQAIHLVSIGDQQLLIGATDQNVSLITHIERDSNTVEERISTTSTLDFGSVLQNFSLPPLTDAAKE